MVIKRNISSDVGMCTPVSATPLVTAVHIVAVSSFPSLGLVTLAESNAPVCELGPFSLTLAVSTLNPRKAAEK